jgi:TonB-dependent receptor
VLTQLALNGYTINDYSTRVTNFGAGLDLPAGTPTSWVIPDLNALDRIINFSCNCVNAYGDFRVTALPSETRSAYERTNSAYAQLDWDTELAGIGFRGNVGLRYYETELEAIGVQTTGAAATPQTVENAYSDTLPSLNLVFEPVESLLVRFAAAETIARPSLDTLTPGGTVGSTSISVGNPYLEPMRSTNYDLSIEYYPYDEALFAIAFFRKDLDTYIQRLRNIVPYSSTGFPLDWLPVGTDPDTDYTVTTYLNTDGGYLEGYEITLQTPFTFLPAPFDNFGAVVNYTSIESEIEYVTNISTGATVPAPFVGASPTALSGTLYYENGGFEARVSAVYRDEYLTLVPAANGNDVEGKASQLNVDFSASYDVNERMTFTFEGLNLTDQFDERWINSAYQFSNNYEHTGREFVFGFRYKY